MTRQMRPKTMCLLFLIFFCSFTIPWTTATAATASLSPRSINSGSQKSKAQSLRKSQSNRIPIVHINGKNLGSMLAQSCSDKNWSSFSTLAKRTHLSSYSFKNTYFVTPNSDGLTLESQSESGGSRVEVKIFPSNFLAVSGEGSVASGQDPCELLAGYMKSISQIDERAATFIAAVSLAGATHLNKNHLPNDLAGLTAAIILGSGHRIGKNSKINLDQILDSNYSFRCNPSITSMQTPIHKIVIHRAPGSKATINFFDRTTDISLELDKNSMFSSEAVQYISKMIKSCRKLSDAESLLQAATHSNEDAANRASDFDDQRTRKPSSATK